MHQEFLQSRRKKKIIDMVKKNFSRLKNYHFFNKAFHKCDQKYHEFLIEPKQSVLDIGSGNGRLLQHLQPSKAVGIDLSQEMVEFCKKEYPQFRFFQHDPERPFPFKDEVFDVVVLSDVIGFFDDIQNVLENIKPFVHSKSRIVISYYNKYWEFFIRLAEKLRIKSPQPAENYLATRDIVKILELSGYEVIRTEYQQLIPFSWCGIGTFINRFVATLPGLRRLCLRTYIVARPRPSFEKTQAYSVSIVIPCRNERGNIESAITRLPRFCDKMQIIFVEGHSQDGTWEEVLRVKEKYKNWDILAFRQTGKGKADAVHLGFAHATGDILMILDADLTVPPEQLPKFYNAIASHQGEFINGTRLIYPLENQAMRFLNFLANKTFSWIFSYLLSQTFSDTLCGTKVFFRQDYYRILEQRKFFGDFDPFGDFELLFGASKLTLKIIEVPIRYEARSYGETQISRFRHGFILARMVVHAYTKLKLLMYASPESHS